jgi:hypothetical protein
MSQKLHKEGLNWPKRVVFFYEWPLREYFEKICLVEIEKTLYQEMCKDHVQDKGGKSGENSDFL